MVKPSPRHAVDVFHTGQLRHALLDGAREEVLHFLRRRPRQHADHVDHRHRDLRLLLPRRRDDGEQPDGERRQRDEGRQLRAQEPLRDPSRDAHG
jgi:hypothetical protein